MAAFDEWLRGYEQTLTPFLGLPAMDELRAPVDDVLVKKSTSKLFLERNKKDARIRVASKKAWSDEQNSRDLPPPVFDSELCLQPFCSFLGTCCFEHGSHRDFTKIPLSRFLLPRNWRTDQTGDQILQVILIFIQEPGHR